MDSKMDQISRVLEGDATVMALANAKDDTDVAKVKALEAFCDRCSRIMEEAFADDSEFKDSVEFLGHVDVRAANRFFGLWYVMNGGLEAQWLDESQVWYVN